MTVALVTAVLGGGLWWLTAGGGPGAGAAPEAAATPPALPTGPLQLLSANVDDVQYLAADQVTKTGDKVQAVVLDAGKTATSISRRYAFEAKRETIDCKARTIGEEVAGYYDGSGKLVTHELQSGALGRPVSGIDAEAAVVCGPPGAPARIVPGWTAVQRQVQTAPDDLVARAKATPQDAELWAWVCANGVRGHWSPSLPKDCDHAVALNPASTATLLDRAFLKLTLRHIPAAQADFSKAIALDPKNAEARFGRALALIMGGKAAAGRADRDRARALDPKVVAWIEANYRDFQVSEPYRSH
ncbi:hypothetical protein [Phenylobacterium sp.]|uniref:tetratricopeptide repeat protein n=1 Tax=Phenylobacterium sp. TaxID=1871053 RepID=UPI002F428B4A